MALQIPTIFRKHTFLSSKAKALRGLAWCLTIPLGLPALLFWAAMLVVVIPLFATRFELALAVLQAMLAVLVFAVVPWALFLWPLNYQFRADVEGVQLGRAWGIVTATMAYFLAAAGPILFFVSLFSTLDDAAILGFGVGLSLISPALVLFGTRILNEN